MVANADIIKTNALNVYYGDFHALKNINLAVPEKEITALIGPSGCGKSTFLRSINRMNDLFPDCRADGEILLDGEDINRPGVDVVGLRARVGMVFQKPNPFPKSIYDNVAYGPRIHGLADTRAGLDDIVEKSLQNAGLWEEVRDKLSARAINLSGGQQQRLCIARATSAPRPTLPAATDRRKP